MALTTKDALADSFKRLLSRRSFDKITVKDIVEDCGVNRQTFYYHFHDIYDLIEWIFQDAADSVDETSLDYDDWVSGLERLLRFLQENRLLILNAYNSISHEVVARYVHQMLRPYCLAIVEHQAQALEKVSSEENIDFVADMMTLTASGLILEWIGRQMKPNDPTLESLHKLRVAMNGALELMLRNLNSAG
jgi:probable dihydroxyacetone kinase regulator